MTAVQATLAMDAASPHPSRHRRSRIDDGVRFAAGMALWLSLLLVTYWWVADGGLQDLGGWTSGLTSLGRIMGLLASDLLLVQVLLMARVPVLEGAFGQDRLAVLHRLIGFTSFNLMVAHIVFITWGYSAGNLASTPARFWDLSVNYPGMLLALAGTLAMVMVVVTSIRMARARLRYESWHLLHLYAYLGVGLALPHQLWNGRAFVTSTAATFFWWGLWAAAAGAVIVWRIALPVWRNLRHRLRVSSLVHEGDGVVSVYVEGRRLDRLGTEPGQFFLWRFLNGEGWTRAHPYSLSAHPNGRSLRISVKALGDGSADLRRVRRGTRVLIEGPYGRLSPRARTRDRIALIGAGVGVTPLRSLAEGLDYAHGDAVLLQRYSERPLFQREVEALGRSRGLQAIYLPGRRRSPQSWLGDGIGPADDLTALLFWVPDIAYRDVYVCGPDAWTESVGRSCAGAGVPPEQFHVETFRW